MKRLICFLLALFIFPASAMADLTLQVIADNNDPRVIITQDGTETVIRPDDPPATYEEDNKIVVVGECKNADVLVLFKPEMPAFVDS